jgi:hypothetical protein
MPNRVRIAAAIVLEKETVPFGSKNLDSIPKLRSHKEERMGARKGRALLLVLTIFVLSAATELYPADKTSVEPSRDSIIRIVTQIQRADYEGDRATLKRLHDELTAIPLVGYFELVDVKPILPNCSPR